MPIQLDLLTVDVVEPRRTAAGAMENTDFRIELDEDDGRWIVLSSDTEPQRIGLQRSDEREVSSRSGGIEDVIDGCLSLEVPAPAATAEFFRDAVALSEAALDSDAESNTDAVLELEGRPVLRITRGVTGPSNLHLDLACEVDEFEREVDRLLDLGAARLGPYRVEHWGHSQIFAAPGGCLFCLNAYTS